MKDGQLDLTYSRVKDEEIEYLDSYRGNTSLTLLNLSENLLTTLCFQQLNSLISDLPSLKTLNLSMNRFSDEISIVIKELKNKKLTCLDLTRVNAGTEAANEISNLILHMSSLSKLCIGSNRFNRTDLENIIDALKENESVQSLYLQSISKKMSREFILSTKNLTCLNINSNEINDAMVLDILKALNDKEGFRKLMLGYNPIGDNGLFALADWMNKCTLLKTIDISCLGNVTSEGILYFIRKLKKNESVEDVNISYNRFSFGDHGALEIGNCLKLNRNLRKLNIGFNNIKSGLEDVLEGLQKNMYLQELHYNGNNVGFHNLIERELYRLKGFKKIKLAVLCMHKSKSEPLSLLPRRLLIYLLDFLE